jgi:site-specific recombinase XerD
MIDVLTAQELNLIISAAFMHSPRLGAACALMGYTGLRVSEVTHLKVEDVWSLGVVRKEICYKPSHGKARRERTLPIVPALANVLSPYILGLPQCPLPTDYLIPNPQGSKLTERAVQIALRKLGYSILGKRVHPHTLRHTFATLLQEKAPIRYVQEALGHASLNTTMLYTHVTQGALANAMETTFPDKKS